MKHWLKRISRDDRVRAVACYLCHLYIRLVFRTIRWRWIRREVFERLWEEGKPCVVAFWHGRLLMMACAWRRDLPFHMLVSSHPDGLLISRTIAYFGIDTVAGSTTRGGLDAVMQMVRHLRDNDSVGITPDGPHGPRMRVSEGVIRVARMAGVPIVPLTFACSRRLVVRSWDRFVVPLPFCNGVFMWGEPIEIDRRADLHSARAAVEARMIALTAEADALCGARPIEPAPAEPSPLNPDPTA